MEKQILVEKRKAKELKTNFGNPRKIKKDKFNELKKSMETYGDFGVFVIDEKDNVIAGNQRLQVLLQTNPEQEILCKKLIGYSESELRAINIKDNTHAGEWDLDVLAEWTADLNVDLGIDPLKKDDEVNNREVEGMELIHYEKYDYVLIACKSEIDYNQLIAKLGLEDKTINVCKTRKIKARAIWYDDMKCQLIEKKDEGNSNE